MTHHALLSIWYPELAEFYKAWRFSSNKNHVTDADMELVPTATAADVSMLPLDTANPTDRSIQAELMATGQGISQKSKRAFFFALTPYHKLYQEAVAKVEKEVTLLLGAKARAAAVAAGQTHDNDNDIEEGATVDEQGSGASSEMDDNEQQETEGDEGEEGGSEGAIDADTFDENHTSARHSSPRNAKNSPNTSPRNSPRNKPRPESVEHGFHNIYLDEASDNEDNEEYYYEDAPAGLRDKQKNRQSNKRPTSKNLSSQRQRRDENSLSFYKHKLVQQVQGQNNASGFLSPLVTHDLYPQAGQEKSASTPTANGDSRYKSLRLDSLYGDKDANIEGLEFSEAEQTVMYLKSGDPTAPTALLSPVVTQGSNPMAGQPKKINVFPLSDDVEGANPMQRRSPAVLIEDHKIEEGEEDGWRVEDASSEGSGSDGSDSKSDGDEEEEEEHDVDHAAAALAPISDVALQFLISLDFRRFDADASRRICRIIGDTMSFLETLWLRYITEDQLRFMFEGYYELKRNHRVASALTSTTGAVGVLGNAAKAPTDIYATKEIKLIGISAEIFKRLQRTSTVNRLRRVLGIQVSLVVIDAEDDTFVDVLSNDNSLSDANSVMNGDSPLPSVITSAAWGSHSVVSDSPSVSAASVGAASSVTGYSTRTPGKVSIAAESDDDEAPQDLDSRQERAVDFPERYQELKRRTKLALISYTNMVGTVPPERISHNSTIVREVVRLAATVKGAQSLSVTLANQFGLIFLDFPGFARIGKELADRGVFNQTNRIIHRLLTHAQIERYMDVIYSIVEQTPSVLLLKDRSDNFLPCDRVKALPDSRPFKYTLLARFINAIPNIDAEYAAARSTDAITPMAKKNAPHDSGTATPTAPDDDAPRLTGDEAFLSLYAGEEELIVRAMHFNMQTTPEEVKEKRFDLRKVDPFTHENIFHKCIACYADEPFIYNSAIETFRVALRVLKERCIGSEFTQLQAEQMLYSVTNTSGLTPWELAAKHSARPMLEIMALDWTKTEAAPPAAVAMSPTRRKPASGVSQSVAAGSSRPSGRGGFGLSADMEMEDLDEIEESEGDFDAEVSPPNTFSNTFNASNRSAISIGLVDVENAEGDE